MEADLARDRAIGLKLGRSVARGFIYFVVAVPGEVDGKSICIAGSADGAGDATEGELAAAFAVEEDVGGLHHIGVAGLVVRHHDDAPLALHAAAPRSLGRRIRL